MSFDLRLTFSIKIINIINFNFPTFATHAEYRFTILDSSLNIHARYIIFTSKADQINKKTLSPILFELVHFDLPINQRYRENSEFLIVGSAESINRFKIFQIFLFQVHCIIVWLFGKALMCFLHFELVNILCNHFWVTIVPAFFDRIRHLACYVSNSLRVSSLSQPC